MPQFQQGQIVVVEIPDPEGKPCSHKHPAVIFSPTDRIESETHVFVIGVSTKFTEPPPSNWVKLPWQRDGRARTGLDRPCVAKCEWLVEVEKSQLLRPIGAVSSSVLVTIIEQVQLLISKKLSAE